MLNACLDKRLFPPAPIWSTILLLLSANAVAGAPLHANDDGTSSVMNSMQTAPLLISTVLRKENADAVQCEPPAVSASKGHCMCPQGTACSGSEQCRGGVSVTTKQHVSGYLQNCAGYVQPSSKFTPCIDLIPAHITQQFRMAVAIHVDSTTSVNVYQTQHKSCRRAKSLTKESVKRTMSNSCCLRRSSFRTSFSFQPYPLKNPPSPTTAREAPNCCTLCSNNPMNGSLNV